MSALASGADVCQQSLKDHRGALALAADGAEKARMLFGLRNRERFAGLSAANPENEG
ncbi:hypothetical protein [Martelella sp. AD-3]|uniref:hypothetical protein n=1 Tax=Martelella sp. AD-3 TaxID=686597 RepID=UPI0004B76D73|nr:hypothetical protein [Martelella sp. AD-3]|tara:strand:+ start:239 stop:409 length:171 start_codon:yes stop_codon:yes gene_type:complete